MDHETQRNRKSVHDPLLHLLHALPPLSNLRHNHSIENLFGHQSWGWFLDMWTQGDTRMAKLRNVSFADYRLTEKEKKEFLSWQKNNEGTLFEYVTQMIRRGNKISISYGEKDQTTIVSVTCWDETSPNHGYCLSSRHADPLTTLGLAIYKIEVVLINTTWEDASKTGSWG